MKYLGNAGAVLVLSGLGALLWRVYWSFEYLKQLDSPFPVPPGSLPRLELSALGLMLFVAFGGVVGAAAALTRVEGRIQKFCLGIALLALCFVFLLIYFRYGMVPPLDYVDQIATGAFVTVYSLVAFSIVSTVAGLR